jgi:hypothetical protein
MWRYVVYLLTWLSGDPADVPREHARAAASIAAARASMVHDADPQPAPTPPSGCCVECRGTGWITHGDGHRTECPCPADCSCKAKKTPCADGQCPVPAGSPTPAAPARL